MAAPASQAQAKVLPASVDIPPGELQNRQWIIHPSRIQSPYTYTPAQIYTYLKEIKFPLPSVALNSTLQFDAGADDDANEDGSATYDQTTSDQAEAIGQVKPTWDNLVKIVRGHLLTFPFDDTPLHYSASHELNVTPKGIYKRLVEERKGGSWCFGMNGLLFGILRGLGYRVYSGAARVNEVPGFVEPYNFTALGHFIIFIQPFADYDVEGNEVGPDGGSKATYLVDVGFGSPALAQPIMLADTEEGVMGVSKGERHRLKRAVGVSRPSTSKRKDGGEEAPLSSWFLQVRHSDQFNNEWRTMYTFTEQEYLLRDYLSFNRSICHSRTIFWHNVFTVLFVPHEESESGMNRIMLFGSQLKAYGETRVLHSERERIQVLKEMFGIDVGDVEEAIQNISGRAAALEQ